MATLNRLARPLDEETAHSITVVLNIGHVHVINALYATGLWGGSCKEVVERLLDEGCRIHALTPPEGRDPNAN